MCEGWVRRHWGMPSKPPLSAAALWQLQRLGAPALAPDGLRVAAPLTTPDVEHDRNRSALWLLHTDGRPPRVLTSCGERDAQPAWSPAGDRIAFVAQRAGDDTPQLYAIAADGGEAQRLARFGPGVSSFRWVPGGQAIVFAAWVWPGLRGAAQQERRHDTWRRRPETGYATEAAFYRYWDHHVPQDRALHLWLLHLDSGRCTDLMAGTGLALPHDTEGNGAYDISPDGRRVAFEFDPAREPRLGNPHALAEIDLRTRRLQPLAATPGWDHTHPRYSPCGTRLACSVAETGRVHTALHQAAVVPLGGRERGTVRRLAPHWDRMVEGPLRWTADGRHLLFAAEDRGRCHLWRLAVDEADAQPQVSFSGGWVQAFDNAAGRTVVLADSARHPARLWACGEGPPRRLETFNDRLLARCALGEVQEHHVTGALGEPVQLWLTFPPRAPRRGRRLPVLQVIHGGPHAAAGDTWGWRWNPHVLAGPGQVVVQVNYHGSSGFGHAFRHSLIGRQGELELQDIEAATAWARRQPWANPDRVFATGGSYGGFLVAWMNAHLPPWPQGPYRAHVCHAGVFDRVATFSADSWPTRPRDLGALWWEDLPRVLAQSPHAHAAGLATPTLVIHGARDYRVPDCNGLAYYNTLQARGVPARLLWFADENHWVLKPRNSLQWYGEFLRWLADHGAARP